MRYSRSLFLALLLLSLLLASCGTASTTSSNPTPTAAPVQLTVFAAASLTESFNEIKKNYSSVHPNVTLTYNFAGSQALEQQLANGATADIFASADQANMQKASTANLVESSKIFVRNRLVVVVPASDPANITTLKDLANKGVKIDVAAPSVPVGKYGLQALDNLGKAPEYGQGYEDSVKANFISQEDNVKAVLNKVQLGEADAGIVYRTDVTTQAEKKVKVIDIPDPYNVVAEYPIAVTKSSKHISDAQTFEQYILSKDGQAVLAKYHFLAPAA